ncbi:MAG: 5'-methylthioadenosine/S-adenosylhomocysteine nucleosidase [Lachnospiraceae bacterium]|nr:5'-methylthioadenosine/S-adenosylhomocysteine nucleosidase [Lachnospiraceae bacterium]
MKRAGLVVAVEMDAVRRRYGRPEKMLLFHGQPVEVYIVGAYELYAFHSGAGEIAAAAAAQLLISECGVEAVFNFGIVGGLTEEISHSRLCVVKSVVHYDFDTSAYDHCEPGRYMQYPSVQIPTTEKFWKAAAKISPDLTPVVCASGDKFVDGGEKKRALHDAWGADICEMEAAGIVMTCDRNRVPCLLIKMVSDGVDGGAEEFAREFDSASDRCLEVLEEVLEEL